ncbi:MAG: hypothetical protein Ta2F_05930 [Termitinemataceae bacterium]|nr:MAG: hypothetical protein Ta2F_05930 [Termitinemataceae bacterium]
MHIRFTILGLLFILLSAFAVPLFAEFDGRLEFSGGVHYIKETNLILDDTEITTNDFSGFAGVSAVFFFNRIGFGEYCNIFFPVTYEVTEKPCYTLNDYKYAMGIDNLLGFSVKIVDGAKFKMPFTIGLHILSFTSVLKDESESLVRTSVGIGGNLSFEFYPVDKFFLFLRASGAYDFYTQIKKTSDSGIGKTRSLFGAPSIGFGFKF